MSSIVVLKNQVGLIDPVSSYPDQGWTIDDAVATHTSCNPGYIKKTNVIFEVGKLYEITYEVLNITSGMVRAELGTTMGAVVTNPGVYKQILLCATNTDFQFYSDGDLSIKYLLVTEQPLDNESNGLTFSFNERGKYWGSYWSYQPETTMKFIDKFITFKNGQPWVHNVNPVRNNFYGEQFVSKITFYANINPTTQKIFYSMRVQGNTVWYCPDNNDIEVRGVDGRPDGMKSRLKKKNFKNYQGSYFADFLRNVLDPRFVVELTALFQAEPLRGRFMKITLTCDDTKEALLYEVDIKSSPSAYTY